MITIKLNDKGKPIEVIHGKKLNVISVPDLDKIFNTVENRSVLECDYSDLLGDGFGVLKDLLNSDNAVLVELGRDFISKIVETYEEVGEEELPDTIVELIEFVLTQSDTNTIL